MTITFTEIVDSEFPDVQFEINIRGGVDLPNMQALKDVWIVAERVAAGTSVANEVRSTAFGSESEALAWFGATSSGAHMASYVYNFLGSIGAPKSKVWGIALAESAGVAATGTFTITNNATAAGTMKIEVGGHEVAIGVAAGDTPTVMGDEVVRVWNALPHYGKCPVVPVNAAGTITWTATGKGAHYNSIATVVTQDPGVTTTFVWTAATLVNGTLYPLITTALTAAAAAPTALMVCPWGEDVAAAPAGTIESLITHINVKAAAGSEIPSKLICAYDDATLANIVTAADNYDDDDGQRILMVGTRSSPVWNGEIAATMAACDAAEPHVARSLDHGTMPDMKPVTTANNWTKSEMDTLLVGGVTPLYVSGGLVKVARAVSIRTAYGVMDWAIMTALDYWRSYLSAGISAACDRMSIIEAANIKTTALHVTTPEKVVSLAYKYSKDVEAEGVIQDVDTYWESMTWSLTGDTLQMQIPGAMLQQWHKTQARLDAEV